MTGHIIPLRGDAHAQVQSLLPWFVTGRLDPEDLEEVTAHLDQCPACRAEVAVERRMRDDVNALPIDLEPAWTRMDALLDAKRPRRSLRVVTAERVSDTWRGLSAARPSWVGFAIAAQAAVVVAVVGLSLRPTPAPAPAPTSAAYRVLGSAPVVASGNMVVIFSPEARESDLRAALRAGHARLVDGPTAADAYVLSVPAEERATALAVLRGRASVVMAEPIDAAGLQ